MVFFFDDCVKSCRFLWLIQNSDNFLFCFKLTHLYCNITELLENCQVIEEYTLLDYANYVKSDTYFKDNYYFEKNLISFFRLLCFLLYVYWEVV